MMFWSKNMKIICPKFYPRKNSIIFEKKSQLLEEKDFFRENGYFQSLKFSFITNEEFPALNLYLLEVQVHHTPKYWCYHFDCHSLQLGWQFEKSAKRRVSPQQNQKIGWLLHLPTLQPSAKFPDGKLWLISISSAPKIKNPKIKEIIVRVW